MKYAQLNQIIREMNLSPEMFAPLTGLSNMTIRRWKLQDPEKEVPKSYERLFVAALQEFVLREPSAKLPADALALLSRALVVNQAVADRLLPTLPAIEDLPLSSAKSVDGNSGGSDDSKS